MRLAAYLPPEAKRRAYASNATFKLALFLSKTCTEDIRAMLTVSLFQGVSLVSRNQLLLHYTFGCQTLGSNSTVRQISLKVLFLQMLDLLEAIVDFSLGGSASLRPENE